MDEDQATPERPEEQAEAPVVSLDAVRRLAEDTTRAAETANVKSYVIEYIGADGEAVSDTIEGTLCFNGPYVTMTDEYGYAIFSINGERLVSLIADEEG